MMSIKRNQSLPSVLRLTRWASALGLAAAALLVVCSAHAYPQNSNLIETHLGLECEPTCMVCHTVDPGIVDTAEKPFVTTLLVNGYLPGDDAALRAALDAITANGADTNSDGTSDIDHLVAYQDPNGELGTLICDPNVQQVAYGCGAHWAPRVSAGSPWPWGLAGGALGLAFLLRRRRKQA